MVLRLLQHNHHVSTDWPYCVHRTRAKYTSFSFCSGWYWSRTCTSSVICARKWSGTSASRARWRASRTCCTSSCSTATAKQRVRKLRCRCLIELRPVRESHSLFDSKVVSGGVVMFSMFTKEKVRGGGTSQCLCTASCWQKCREMEQAWSASPVALGNSFKNSREISELFRSLPFLLHAAHQWTFWTVPKPGLCHAATCNKKQCIDLH